MKFLTVVIFSFSLLGCVQQKPLAEKNSHLTQGNVQLSIQVGKTTKLEVLESFGAPNITTRNGRGEEVWTYQRSGQASQSVSNSQYWTVLLAGASSNSTGFETSSKMITLIIKFSSSDLVSDFNSRTSNF